MPTPSSILVEVDSPEYSRYETALDTITATAYLSGGAPYVSLPVSFELIKARRSRDQIPASTATVVTSTSDPSEAVGSFYLPDIADADCFNLVRHGKYFVRARYAGTYATSSIGSGANGTITATAPTLGTPGNAYTIEVVVPVGTQAPSASVSGTSIILSLGTVSGVPTAATNSTAQLTSVLLAQGVTASYSGNGTDIFTTAEGPNLFVGGTDAVQGDSADFDIRILSVSKFKEQFLFGVDLKSTGVLAPKFQPNLPGVSIVEVSRGHAKGLCTLNYVYNNEETDAAVSIGTGVDGTIEVLAGGALTGTTGNSYTINVVIPAGTSPLSASLVSNVLTVSLDVTAGVPTVGANTATLVAASINAVGDFVATAGGTGASELSTAELAPFTGGTTIETRFLSWCGGPLTAVTGAGTYILTAPATGPAAKLAGAVAASSYVCVRVASPAFLPTMSTSEQVLIEPKTLSDDVLATYLSEAISYLENDFLNVYLEPTILVTDKDFTTIQYEPGLGTNVPIAVEADYDFIKNPLTYYIPKTESRWVEIVTPFPALLRVDSLFGSIANTRVIDIDLEWIEHIEQGGLIQLVPYSQEQAFNFTGLLWVNAIRAAQEIPNFWHFNFLAGLRFAPAEVIEYIGKYAGINALTAAALAYRPGIGSLSLSRDGVSESTSYNTQATYGIYSGTIQSYKDWMEATEPHLLARYRGLRMVVV